MSVRASGRALLAALSASIALGGLLGGCGQKGPLTLPDRKGHAAKPASAPSAAPPAQPAAAAPAPPADANAQDQKKQPDDPDK